MMLDQRILGHAIWSTLLSHQTKAQMAQVPDSLPHISPGPDAPGLSKFWVDTDTPITVTYTDIF